MATTKNKKKMSGAALRLANGKVSCKYLIKVAKWSGERHDRTNAREWCLLVEQDALKLGYKKTAATYRRLAEGFRRR